MSQYRRDDSWTPPPISDVWSDLLDTSDYDREMEARADEIVEEEFEKIEMKYENTIRRIAGKQFESCLREYGVSCKTYKLYGGSHLRETKLPFIRRFNKDNMFVSAEKISRNGDVEIMSCPKIIIRSSRSLPRMRYWVHTERNLEVPDNLRLSHIPHITDDLDDREFVTDLRELYSEGIHGADHGCGKYINDYMMYLLLKRMDVLWSDDKLYVYVAIFKQFPNKYTLTNFKEGLFLTLRERFEKYKLDVDPASLDVAQTIFCVKCLQYDCVLHIKDELPTMHDIETTVTPGILSKHICCESCYQISVVEASFNVEPQSLLNTFKILLSSDRHKFCNVAKIMNIMLSELDQPVRTCAEWYSISQPFRKKEQEVKKAVFKIKHQQYLRDRYRTFSKLVSNVEYTCKITTCKHTGSCETSDDCECYKNGVACSKFCLCDMGCLIRFPGCACSPGRCNVSTCNCYIANWECDPDVCVFCNCDVNNIQKDESDNNYPLCRNIGIQLGLKKNIEIGISMVSGWGCFMKGTAMKGDLISEYTGEIITQSEAERRGRIYDRVSISYVFDLNADESIDAGRYGNLIRFANHSATNPNCEAKVMVVDGHQRIGIYASRHLHVGEEIVFDYRYQGDSKQLVPIENVNPKLK